MTFKHSFAYLTVLSMAVSLAFSTSIGFNRDLTGVHFNPYVKSSRARGQAQVSCLGQYTFEELKTMLEIVSTKFSRVATNTVDASNVSFIPHETYYNYSCIVARTAEAAAVINRERNNKTITVLIGIDKYFDEQGGEYRTATEVNVALEAEQIANSIYPGTVEGFQVSCDVTHLTDEASGALIINWASYLRNRTKGKNLQIGLIALPRGKAYNPSAIPNSNIFSFDENQAGLRKLVANLDFINIKYYVNTDQAVKGPYESCSFYGKLHLFYETLLQQIYPKLYLMQSSGWPSDGNYDFFNIDNMVKYWKAMDEYATKNNRTIWLEQAFDNPSDTNAHYTIIDFQHFGWWKLTNDELADQSTRYVEKYLEMKSERPNLVWVWLGVGVTTAALVILLLSVLVVTIYQKVNSLEEALTKEEIDEFMHGMSESFASELDVDQVACKNALSKPYDERLEIPKDMLEIYWEEVLGVGQFGCVYKALLKCPTPTEIALKTTRRNCPTSALRGILSEIKILAHIGMHPNIVHICGAYTAELTKGKVYMAIELCPKGSLRSHLVRLARNAGGNGNYVNVTNNQNDMMRWSYEIAVGMEHLENKGVVHADLATRNMLLSIDGTAKISDFGLSRRLYEYSNYAKQQQEPLPWRWMAIESLRMKVISHKSDVWSYGVTIWEIFSLGAEPYPGLSWKVDFVDRLEDGLRLTRPHLASSKIYKLMLQCWHKQPDMRPCFTSLVSQVLEIRNQD